MNKYLLFNTDQFNRQGLYKGKRYKITRINEYSDVITFLNSIGEEKQVNGDYVRKGTDIKLVNKMGNFHLF